MNKLDMNLPALDVDVSIPCPNDNGGHNGHGPGRRHTPLGGRGRGGLAPSRGRGWYGGRGRGGIAPSRGHGWYGGRGGSLSTLNRQCRGEQLHTVPMRVGDDDVVEVINISDSDPDITEVGEDDMQVANDLNGDMHQISETGSN
ncbi:unnamed protein product [Arabis nemorensis]|uniref:Uncharacterized protein n=1 Tax=Arabis nemorensis TaxID=586526 RepID=A0A565B2K3_9BRAS|nr:unnamed protein product [Arabis nemorensis]